MPDSDGDNGAGAPRVMRTDGVTRMATCRLSLTCAAWPYARTNARPIDAHWARRHAENPAMFNGVIHLLHGMTRDGDAFRGRLLRSDFKSYLYWREQGFPEAGVLDAFGSALIRSSDGHVLLGRQRAGNVNAGLAYLPGGFIDERDVRDAEIDIDASILRELAEETGLARGDYEVLPGYLLTASGALLSIAREVVSPLPAEALRARILAHIAADPKSELVDAVIVRSAADLDDARMHAYAHRLLTWVFAAG
jgi:8-oxo-dGTP pyrophosphatase MutT (NUDIX family)